MRRACLLVIALVAASGCNRAEEWYPLRVGNSWSYNVRTGMAEFVESVRVLRPAPAAGTRGFELGGPLGTSRIAWVGGVLYASELPNLTVAEGSEPLPLFVAGDPDAKRSWKGKLVVSGKQYVATGNLKQAKAKLSTPGRTWDTLLATLTLKVGDRTVELQSWYAKGFGPIRQEQRTDGVWNVGCDYLSGP